MRIFGVNIIGKKEQRRQWRYERRMLIYHYILGLVIGMSTVYLIIWKDSNGR